MESSGRFSLLLLEEGELYIQDHACCYYRAPDERGVRGRVRLCSRSVFFEPGQISLPVIRIPLSKVTQMGQARGRCVLVASEIIEMKRNGRDYPYQFHEELCQHEFSLDHSASDPFLLCVAELFRVSKMSNASPETRLALAEIVRRNRDVAQPFKLSSLVDLNEELLADRLCKRIKPFIVEPCRLVVTTKRLYLQPVDDIEGQTHILELRLVRQIFRRRHALREIGLEVLLEKKAVFVAFDNMSERDAIFDLLMRHPVVNVSIDKDSSDMVTAKWVRGEISNFDYLMYVNNLAGRTKNDLAQYPVFPWILADYSSSTLDLKNPRTFRDLSKPMGALNPQRLETFRKRMREMPVDGQEFLYGTHYSTPGYVLFYLVRKRPELMLHLQNGKFDAPDRSFFSISETWQSCMQSPTDLKELIPEFFSDASIFENAKNLDLGVRQNGARVGDVELPAWCQQPNDFKGFVEMHRAALESEHVSAHLHEWIDLIFGYKQRGLEAKRADNLFYPLTYQGMLDMESVEDELMRASYEVQISEFGQTPKQVFFAAHPKRFSTSSLVLGSSSIASGASSSLSAASTASLLKDPKSSVDSSSLDELLGSQVVVVKRSSPVNASVVLDSTIEKARASVQDMKVHERLHREEILGIDWDGNTLVSVSKDQNIKVHLRDLENEGSLKQLRACNVSNFPLSCCQFLTNDLVLIGAWDSKVHCYSIQFNRAVDSWKAHDDSVAALCFSGSRLCTGGWDTLVRLWDVRGDSIDKFPVSELDQLDGEVSSVDLQENGVFLAASTNGKILLGDCRVPDHFVDSFQCDDEIRAVKLLADGKRGICGNSLLDLTGGEFVAIADTPEDVSALQVVGPSMALMAFDARVELWDVAGRSKVKLFEDSEVWSSNTSRITSFKVDGTAGFFGTQEGRLIFY